MSVTFLFPVAAWLFLLLPLLWWPMRARPRWGRLAWRAAVLACIVVAMMQPSLVRRAGAGEQVLILDQREALGTSGQAAARAALAKIVATLPGDARRTLIQIGGRAGPAGLPPARVVTDGSLSTAFGAALDRIALGSGAAVTFIGNGRSTDPHWQEAVDAFAARAIPVNSIDVPLAPRSAFVSDVAVAPARVGEKLHLDVTVEGDGGTHRLTVFEGERQVGASAPFVADAPTRVAIDLPAGRAGFRPLRVALDGRVQFDALAAVQDPLRLLYLGERQEGAAALLQRLLGPGIAVDQRPATAAFDPAGWPVVLVDDLPAARFPVVAQQRLNRAVARHGTGLLVTGGMAAFGAGGYAQAPLGAALPVTARQQDRQIRPSVALAVVIDSSGSMQGARLELAKQVARRTVAKLTPNDWVGVVEFYGARQWSVPMHHATDLADIDRSIARMQAQGASVLFPALQEAFYGLKDLDARYKHILVLSDGGVAEDRYQQLLRHIAQNRINISTVAVGGQVDDEQSMADWARIGRGRFYSIPDEFSLVELDFKQPQTTPEPAYRSGSVELRAVGPAGWWDGQDLTAPPPLSGYVRTRPRPEAATLLQTGDGDPVLATWQVGSGRVTALMTEPLGNGTASWRNWADYGRWLARVIAMTARSRPDMTVDVSRRFDRLRITAQRNTAGPVPAMWLVDVGGRPLRRIEGVEARAPGLFEAELALPNREPARIEVRDGATVVRAADAAASDIRAEEAMASTMALPLAQLSQRTGGWHRTDPAADPGPAQPVAGWRATDLWPWLTLLALLLYLAEVGYRRWPARHPTGAR